MKESQFVVTKSTYFHHHYRIQFCISQNLKWEILKLHDPAIHQNEPLMPGIKKKPKRQQLLC